MGAWRYERRNIQMPPNRMNRQRDQSALRRTQPIKFEMAINLQTVKALGLNLSDNLLSLADEVIE
jgi:hypothetical protein